MPKGTKAEAEPDVLKGWQQIAAFLGQPVAVAQRRATEGMPLQKARSLSPVISRGIEPLVRSGICRGARPNCHRRNRPKRGTKARTFFPSKAKLKEEQEKGPITEAPVFPVSTAVPLTNVLFGLLYI